MNKVIETLTASCGVSGECAALDLIERIRCEHCRWYDTSSPPGADNCQLCMEPHDYISSAVPGDFFCALFEEAK